MAKRSNFKRRQADKYLTIDPRAVKTLLPYLKDNTKFAEPCCGEGHLVDELERYGHKCIHKSDLPIDALTLPKFDLVITNPPWSRPILHELIDYWDEAWLLFDAGWAYTKQSSEYMKRCTDIVPVGRLKWIENTTMQGKDDCSWYKFSRIESPTIFHRRENG